MTKPYIAPCPECWGECVASPRDGLIGSCEVQCNSCASHLVLGKTVSIAIAKHNAIPRWLNYTISPKRSGVFYVAYHGGHDTAIYNTMSGKWATMTGTEIRILKWTELPADLPPFVEQ